MHVPGAKARLAAFALSAAICIGGAGGASAARAGGGPILPEILATQSGSVPACVTPERLMATLVEHNRSLDPRYRDIAALYKTHGEALGIRWDYAFYQMQLETNHLTFRRGNGDPGDVRARQNNFAGIGATGGGVPGDSFPDISTGVLAQMQHLLAYAGQRIDAPVAPRTREFQGDIIEESRALRRPVRFSDLTNRWAADRSYARSIEVIAGHYQDTYCKPGSEAARQDPAADTRSGASETRTAQADAPRGRLTGAEAAGAAGGACDVWSASFGGSAALLIRALDGAVVNYTVLQVEAGREQPQGDAFIAAHARNGTAIGRFASRDQALARAFELCRGPS